MGAPGQELRVLTGRPVRWFPSRRAGLLFDIFNYALDVAAWVAVWRGVTSALTSQGSQVHLKALCEMRLTLPEVALISGHKDPRMLFRYMNLRPADLAVKLTGREWGASSG